jgi:hypothetical protein
MTGFILVLAFVLLIGPLAVLYGADSRIPDDRDRRGWWPGAPRPR